MTRASVLARRRKRADFTQAPVSWFPILLLLVLVTAMVLLAGCARNRPEPPSLRPTEEAEASSPEPEYRLRAGDEIAIAVVGQPDFSKTVRVRPDGRMSAPGIGEIPAVGLTIAEVTEAVRAGLRRLVRYPDVSIMLTSSAEEVVYIFGEVRAPGAHPYLPNMTALHALGAAGGPRETGKLSSVMVLRRTGPSALDVYPLNLEAAVDGALITRDITLRPYDVIFVPRTLIAQINLFVDQFVRQNITPFSAYLEGWRAFHADEIYYRATRE